MQSLWEWELLKNNHNENITEKTSRTASNNIWTVNILKWYITRFESNESERDRPIGIFMRLGKIAWNDWYITLNKFDISFWPKIDE